MMMAEEIASQSNTTIKESSTTVEKIQSDNSSLPDDLAGSLLIPDIAYTLE